MVGFSSHGEELLSESHASTFLPLMRTYKLWSVEERQPGPVLNAVLAVAWEADGWGYFARGSQPVIISSP